MLWNLYDAKENSSATISTFKGLDRKYKGQNGEFYDMKNMSSNGYPCMTPRMGREVVDQEHKNIRMLIKPLNKGLKYDTPLFTGIADYKSGETDESGEIIGSSDYSNYSESVLYYMGKKVSIEQTEFAQGYDDGTGEDLHYIDTTSLFPKGDGTQMCYTYMNSRLFIFVTNSTDFGDVESLEVKSVEDNKILLKSAIDADTAEKILYRNVSLKASDEHDYDLRYYVIGVDALNGIIYVNADIDKNPYRETSYGIDYTLYPVHDSIKLYYDAGRENSKLRNAERGIYNFGGDIKNTSYTDADTGIVYEKAVGVFSGDDVDFSTVFENGDRVRLSKCLYSENNTLLVDTNYEEIDDTSFISATVIGIDGYKLYLQLINAEGEYAELENQETSYNPFICVFKPVPNMVSVVCHNQRLWGVNPNGEYYYASAVSDPFTWYGGNYGTESKPLEMQAGTEDEYVGIVELGQNVILLKPTSIQQVYSLASAQTVSVTRAVYNVGCIDGRSAVVIGATLYYLGYNGFYQYTGSQPEIISAKLNTRYSRAAAVTDGVKYYVSAEKESGETELLVYDTQYGVWHKEDDLNVGGGYIWYDKPIVVSDDTVLRFNAQSSDETFDWYAESVIMFEGTMDNKAVNDLWIRAAIPKGSAVNVYTEVNGGGWKEHFEMKGTGNIKVYRVPVRAQNAEYYKFKLAGEGGAVIYDIERVIHIDGRPYR